MLKYTFVVTNVSKYKIAVVRLEANPLALRCKIYVSLQKDFNNLRLPGSKTSIFNGNAAQVMDSEFGVIVFNDLFGIRYINYY